MRLHVAEILAASWAMFRRDRAVLLAVAGIFFFLPTLALLMLVPAWPMPAAGIEAGSAEATAAATALVEWTMRYAVWWIAGFAVLAWGMLALFVLYLDRDGPDVGAALARAGRLWPRFALLILLATPPFFAGLMLFTLPALFVMARLMLAGPAMIAERPLAAGAAMGRGWRLSRGASWPLTALVAVTVGLGTFVSRSVLRLDDWQRAQADGANPVALVMVDALAAAIVAAAALAAALVAIAVYRRVAR